MTLQEFIKKFKALCRKKDIQDICLETWKANIKIFYINPFISIFDIKTGTISKIWFDEYENFYINFSETDFSASEEDLVCNTDDVWYDIWIKIKENIDLDDIEFNVGDSVFWNDPAINDYPQYEREEMLNRRFVIFKIEGDIISISDTYTTAEVYAEELILI